jgi:hypothetical protein
MQMTNRPPVNPSALTEGWHPGFLLHISEEATPADWQMAKQSPTMYRWHFCLWETPTLLERQAPEQQSGLTSTKFTPKGRFQASKAYVWTTQLLGRQIVPGESINYDTLYPLPCRVKVQRDPGKDYVKIVDVEAWNEGQQYLAGLQPALMQARRALLDTPAADVPPPAPQPAPAATPPPAIQGWGGQAPAAPTTHAQTPSAPRW